MQLSRLLATAVLAVLSAIPPAHAGRPVAGSVTPERLKVPSGPSSVRGLADEPSVDPFMAQLDYQVPIELPPGLGGLMPALALTYSGALGNGPLGIGWTLAESKIERSTRLGVPRFNDSDTLEISGVASGRLVAIDGGEYRIEGMGQTVRVRRAGDGFEVDDGTGVRYKLGLTASARQAQGARVLAWRLEEQTNLMGERIRYEYLHDRSQVYLSRITWGPGDMYRVDLVYEARGDVTMSYREGFRVETARRLAAIRVTAAGTERRAYQLAYDASFPVARLAGVTSTGRAGAGAWPALTFGYAARATPVITPLSVGSWRLNASGTTLVDLDGDGAAELLQLASTGHSYLSNTNGTFGGLQPLSGNTQAIAAVQLHDIDGDSRAELLQDTGNGWAVYKFSRTQWLSQAATLPNGVWPGTPGLALKQPTTTRFADLDGDGLVDAIKWDNDGLRIHRATRTGIAAPFSAPRIGGTALPTAQGRFQDVNGDGLDDYLLTATDKLRRFIGRGDGTFDAAVNISYPFPGTLTNPEDVELTDLDRDGLTDLVRIELGTVRWFRGRTDGTFVTTPVNLANPETLSAAVVVAVADVDGNGSQDVVWSSTSGMWRMDLAGATSAGMLVRVQNGLGIDATYEYRSSHALAMEAKAAGSAWASHVPIAIPVPVRKVTALGAGETTRRINYGVRDPLWDAVEQRFGGFMTTTVTTAGATPAQTGTVITSYHSGLGADRVLRGKPLTEQVKDGTGRRLSLTTNTWEAMPIAGLPAAEPLLRRAVQRQKVVQHEDTTPVRKTDIAYEYDALGRVRREVDSGRLDITGDESIKLSQYADDDVHWIRDRLCDDKVTDLAGAVASHTQHLFGDDLAVQPLCSVGKGWPRETRAWLASESRFVTTEHTRYDARGNAIAVIAKGIERLLAYDPSGLFPAEERLGALVWRATWDPVLGVQTEHTDPNGHTTHRTFDELGRLASVAVDGRAPHQHIEYDWVAPSPKTVVWAFDGPLAEVGPRPTTWTEGSRWRQTVDVTNGKGEVRYKAVRLAAARWIISDYRERDPDSRVVFAGRPVYAGTLDHASRPAGIVGDTLAYDPLGRLIEQRLPTGAAQTYAYVAFERTLREADLAPVHSVLDGKGRAILTERSLPDGTHEVVQASYDAAGRLTQMSLSGGTVQRAFVYDTLGRLIESRDPDLGTRTLRWDDGDRLVQETNAAGQTTRYTYDALGRLASRDSGAPYRFHYDEPRPGATGATNLAGRLAWVEEPTGVADTGYDELGQLTLSRHQIDDQVSETTTAFAASGLVLARGFDDGFTITHRHDPAGRLVELDDLWQLLDQDAEGGPLHERTANGVETRYTRDVLGLTSRVTVRDAAGTAIYDVAATRNTATAITAITDHDGIGLDHDAQFTYDGFSRLTSARLGEFTFGYAYDVLHNMTSRTQAGPRTLAMFSGAYRYAEAGRAPRQLTSIRGANGAVVHSFGYDAAGRQISQDNLVMTYDGADRLLSVAGLPGGTLQHAYGATTDRVKTISPDGTVAYYFSDGTSLRGGVREHDVTVGARVVARVAVAADEASGAALGSLARPAWWLLAALALIIALAVARIRIFVRRRVMAAFAAYALLSGGCGSASLGTTGALVTTATHAKFAHAGFAAGPAMFTDAGGELLEERRYEPFGAPIDARIRSGSTHSVGAPDVVARDLNALNKRTEAASGWSDHGARWLAPETSRWLTTDPPVEGPDAKFMFAPWRLHPYQYVDQNPIAYWDPDGRELARLNGLRTFDPCAQIRHAPANVLNRALFGTEENAALIWVPGFIKDQPRVVLELFQGGANVTRDIMTDVAKSSAACAKNPAPIPTRDSSPTHPTPSVRDHVPLSKILWDHLRRRVREDRQWAAQRAAEKQLEAQAAATPSPAAATPSPAAATPSPDTSAQ
jgi:RHS repeat-associated protein